jgi:hypothetical protein
MKLNTDYKRQDFFTQNRRLDAKLNNRGIKQRYTKVEAEEVRGEGIY